MNIVEDLAARKLPVQEHLRINAAILRRMRKRIAKMQRENAGRRSRVLRQLDAAEWLLRGLIRFRERWCEEHPHVFLSEIERDHEGLLVKLAAVRTIRKKVLAGKRGPHQAQWDAIFAPDRWKCGEQILTIWEHRGLWPERARR